MEEYFNYLNQTKEQETINDQEFHYAVRTGLELELFTVRDLAHKIGINLPCIERWAEGKSEPPQIMRPLALELILELITEKSLNL